MTWSDVLMWVILIFSTTISVLIVLSFIDVMKTNAHKRARDERTWNKNQ